MQERRTERGAPRAGLAAVLTATVLVLGLPLAGLAADAARGWLGAGERWVLPWRAIGDSAVWGGVIAGVAALLGLPLAWACRGGGRWAGLLLAPAFFPGFLAYSGWGMLRAPSSATGAWIDSMRQSGWERLPHAVDTVLAVGGLALWAAPAAAACMLPAVRGVSDDVLEAAGLEGGFWRAAGPTMRRAWVFGAGAVFALMLGSAIPLHLARVNTAAIVLWAQLDLTPADRHWEVWVAGWPLAVAAVLFGVGAARLAAGAMTVESPEVRRRASAGARWTAAAILGLGTAGPLVLYALQLRSPGSVARYARSHGGAIGTSVGIAVLVGAVCVVLAMAVHHAGTTGERGRRLRVLSWVLGVWTAAGVLPGVMVGSAVSRGFAGLARVLPGWMDASDSVLPIAGAHLARVGFLAAAVGLWLAASEPRDEREARRVDGAETVWGWLRAAGAARAWALWGVFAGGFALSVQEIEASVLTLWPGGALLGRQLLNDLHFFRADELGAGVVLLALAVGPAGAAAVWWLGRGERRGGVS